VFAIPGICGLIVFLLARPQEFFLPLQRLPLLYLFCFAALAGLALDLKLRRLEPVIAPSAPWVAMLLIWIVICDAVNVPADLISKIIDVGILGTVYVTIAHGIQRFRSLQIVAGATMLTCLFIASVCWHQGFQERTCIVVAEGAAMGIPTGRPCQLKLDCEEDATEPGQEFRCEKAGLFGTYSIEDRVRYRGELHDPNEVAMLICVGGLSFAIAFALRRRRAPEILFGVFASTLVLWTVIMTQSRGGLVVLMAVPAVYAINRWGIRALLLGLMVALPVLMLGGRSGESAEESTFFRYEAWGAGLGMFKQSPVFGVGHREFSEHWWLTAHNSYVLTLSELGIIGFFLFSAVIFMSVKTVWRGVRELAVEPGAAVARTWGLALLASMSGLIFQINTLSFAYHPVLWTFIGLCGGYGSAVRHHKPDFRVRMEPRDAAFLVTAVLAYALAILPLYLKWKHAM
jgi:hypothetical protein